MSIPMQPIGLKPRRELAPPRAAGPWPSGLGAPKAQPPGGLGRFDLRQDGGANGDRTAHGARGGSLWRAAAGFSAIGSMRRSKGPRSQELKPTTTGSAPDRCERFDESPNPRTRLARPRHPGPVIWGQDGSTFGKWSGRPDLNRRPPAPRPSDAEAASAQAPSLLALDAFECS